MPTPEFTMPHALRRATPAPRIVSGGDLLWWLLAGLTTAATVLVHWYIALSAHAARTPWDENSLLQMSRLIAGEAHVEELLTRGYFPGPSVLMAPVWWFTDDAYTAYGWSNAISNVFGIATIVPLALIARNLGLRLHQSIAVGATAMLMITRTGHADYVLSEQFLTFFVAWVPVAAFALWRRPTIGRTLLLVGAALAAAFMHGRGMVVVAVAGVWLAAFFVRSRLASVVGIVTLAVGMYGVQQVSLLITNAVTEGGFDQDTGLVTNLLGASPGMLAHVTLSHSWSHIIGSFGMVTVGAVVLTVWVFRQLLGSWRLGPAAMMWGLAVAGMILSIAPWLPWESHFNDFGFPEARLDSWIYSRYADPFVLPVILVGLAAVVKGVRRSVLALSLAITTAWCAAVVFWATNVIPTWGSSYGPMNSAALYPFYGLLPGRDEPGASLYGMGREFELPLTPTFTNDNRFWLIASVVAIAVLAVVLLLQSVPIVALAFVAGAYAVGSIVGNPSQERVVPTPILEGVQTVEEVAGDQVAVDFDLTCDATYGDRQTIVNWIAVWLSPRDFELVDTTQEDFDTDVVVACGDGPSRDAEGAVKVADSYDRGFAVWVLDGELADLLEAEGLVEQPAS